MDIISGTCRFGFWYLISVFFPPLSTEESIPINYGGQGSNFFAVILEDTTKESPNYCAEMLQQSMSENFTAFSSAWH